MFILTQKSKMVKNNALTIEFALGVDPCMPERYNGE